MNCGLLWGNRQDCIKVSCFSPKTGIRKKHQLKLGLCENKATLKVFQINCGLVLFNARWNKSTMFIKGSNIKIHRLEEVLFERFELFRVMCCFASRVRSPAFAHVFSLELCIKLSLFLQWNDGTHVSFSPYCHQSGTILGHLDTPITPENGESLYQWIGLRENLNRKP